MPRRSSSPLLSPPVLIILLPTVILLFLIYAIPPLLSLTSHILQPTVSVKKSWDSLNVFLVIFAILCGVFARKHDDAGEGLPDADNPHVHIHNASNPLLGSPISRTTSSPRSDSSVLLTPQQQWFGYPERTPKMYDTTPIRTPENVGGGRLRRRSSYPDLRQVESLWQTLDDVQTKSQFRFFDDFEISNYRTHRQHRETSFDDAKEIPVDTFVLQSSPTPVKSPTPPPPPPPRRQKQRTYETVGRRKKEEMKVVEEVRSTPPPTPPPPPPPRLVAPASPMRVRSDHKHGRLERRKSNVKREIAMVWNSVLSNQRKRKRKQKATRNIEHTVAPESLPEQSQPVPPPPPPPPPSSVFHNLFKKGSKTKKVHSVSSAAPPPVPPPPPPPAVSVRTHQARRSTMPPRAPPTPPRPPPSAHSRRRPPLPTKPSTTSYEDNVLNSGSQSPLIPIPPPPPPFKMPEMRFFVKGDFVKIQSAQSSRSGSPEPPEEAVDDHALPAGKEESTSSSTVNLTEGGEGAGKASASVFCPSPDVNTKADNFIARLRDEWKLEKMNSLREKKIK